MDEEDELSELIEGRIVNIFYLFSQAENYVKEVVADHVVLKSEPFSCSIDGFFNTMQEFLKIYDV